MEKTAIGSRIREARLKKKGTQEYGTKIGAEFSAPQTVEKVALPQACININSFCRDSRRRPSVS